MMQITLDDGYAFGLGLFETIAVEKGAPVLAEAHLARLQCSMDALDICCTAADGLLTPEGLVTAAADCSYDNGVMKVSVSAQNAFVTYRENHYGQADYDRGFRVGISAVRRNETSPLVYHKTANYGDNIMEKRRAGRRGIDEPVFVNTRGELCEGATTNLFFVKGDMLYTPPVRCGLLAGTLRDWVMDRYPVEERVIYPEDLFLYDEVFLTNALLGVMPVCGWEGRMLAHQARSRTILADYRAFVAAAATKL